MNSFKYKAKTRVGETVKGVVTADDQPAARKQLLEQGLLIMEIKRDHSLKAQHLNPLWLFNRYVVNPLFAGATVHDLAVYYRQLATMMKAGMTLSECMSSLSISGGNRRLRRISAETLSLIVGGERLSEAFARYPWMFPELHVFLIRAGEENGMLDRMLDRIAQYLENENKIRQKLRMQTLYPKILVLAVIFIPALPTLVFQGFNAYIRATFGNLIPLLGIIAIAWGLFRLINQVPMVRYSFELIKLSLPRFGKMTRMTALAKFYRVFAAMYEAGVPISQGLTHSAKACGNRYLETKIKSIIPAVERGTSMYDALARAHVLPQMAMDMLRTGEKTGNVDGMLISAAEYTESEAEVAIMQTTIIVGVVMFLAIAMYLAFAVIIPGFQHGYTDQIENFSGEE